MSGSYVDDQRREYFLALRSENLSAAELVRLLYNYLGPVYQDQITLLREALDQRAARAGEPAWAEPDLFSQTQGLGARACATLGKSRASLYFVPTTENILTWCLFPEQPNECRSIKLPFPLSQRLSFPRRPELKLHHLHAPSLFVSPNGFCVFDPANRVHWPVASTRCFPTTIAELPEHSVDGPVVLIQDRGDGSNFAHFLFDQIFRIALFCRQARGPGKTSFIMGGRKTAFHEEIIHSLCSILGLSERNFLWPAAEMRFNLPNGIFVFSDSVLESVHPAYMAHPSAIELIQSVAERLRIEPGGLRRIYVSRSDTAFRRLGNETTLLAALSKWNYETIQLGTLGIRDQFSVMAGARSIIAPHGMGLTHIALRDGPLDLLELFNPLVGSDAYAFIAKAKGFCHAHLVGRDLADERGGFEIDVPAVCGFAHNMA